MASSYVPEDSKVICTFMTCGVPQMLQVPPGKTRTIIHTNKKKPLLSIEDKKLSGCFQCQVKASFWGGLQALCLGIAMAALAVATVATGGLALVAAGVALAASVSSIAAGGTGLYSIAHACDQTLSPKSEWNFPHDTVYFNKKKALLNGSVLHCMNGGMLSIVMNPQIAISAASEISTYNMNAVDAQMSSQFTIGLITGFVGLGTGSAGMASILLTPVVYCPTEIISNELEANALNSVMVNTSSSITSDFVTNGFKSTVVNPTVGNYLRGLAEYGVSQVTDDVSLGLMGAFRTAITQKALTNVPQGQYLSNAHSIGGLLANMAIGTTSDIYEGKQKEVAAKRSSKATEEDMSLVQKGSKGGVFSKMQ